MLHIGFTLPLPDVKRTEDVTDPFTGLGSGAVTDEAARSATSADLVLEGVRELLFGGHAPDIAYEGCTSNEELRHGGAIVDGWCIGEHGVCSQILITSRGVDGRVRRFEPLSKDGAHRDTCELCGCLESVFDDFGGLP
jgi:hypothetical protein